tara:strand:- start:1702 stop:2058 length:357 start_codon:yes stop_codon:yes gene_type:complete
MEIGNALLDFGALGIFCAFLVWQHLTMQKRLDKMSDEWRDSLAAVETEHAAAEQNIRDRYDAILQRYESTRESIYKDVVETLNSNRATLTELVSKIDELRQEVRLSNVDAVKKGDSIR